MAYTGSKVTPIYSALPKQYIMNIFNYHSTYEADNIQQVNKCKSISKESRCGEGKVATYVIGSEKTTLMAQNYFFVHILHRVKVTSVLYILQFVSGA